MRGEIEFAPGQDFHVERETWTPTPWSSLEDRPPVLPTMSGLVYPGQRHVFSGPPESAKTWAALVVALDFIRAGGVVAHVDFEMFAHETRDRLRALGATADELGRFLHFEPDTPANDAVIGALVENWSPGLAIIDAAAGAYALQGLDDNKRQDVEVFARTFIDPFRSRGVGSIVLDHVVKNGEARGSWASGSERKVGSADVHLGFEEVVPFGRGRVGLIRILTRKDRPARLLRPAAAELELRSDPETGAVTWQFRPPSATSGGDAWRPTALMERVSRYLEQQTGPVSRSDVETNVRGKGMYVRQALDELAGEGYVSEDVGARGARLVTLLQPFSEATSSQLVPVRPDLVPGADQPTSSPVPPSKGDGDGDEVDEAEFERLAQLYRDEVEEAAT